MSELYLFKMEINLDCSGKTTTFSNLYTTPLKFGYYLMIDLLCIIDIMNNEFSEFLDNNSQICINQEEGEIVGAQLVEVNISPTINLQTLKTEEVVLNF